MQAAGDPRKSPKLMQRPHVKERISKKQRLVNSIAAREQTVRPLPEINLPPSFAHKIIRRFPSLGPRLRTAASRAEPASAALSDVANSFGVLYPRLLCGLSSLYSFCHTAPYCRASNKFWNQLTAKHSSRNTPRQEVPTR